ncbi:adenine nucleotide alpha hydrolases-like superfamily protein [Actinidia rufa]|uniref:Adenine nucleotide alpha hydrolases-like superfamily protein n=1 Tax=Actinidia rufa TaxID=165716 RepID=A0A7J0DEG1_9ERIC|nr:adenine nucleotide alpha hydrolases-like superfamily protein [Actinidia rufa]
MEEEKMRMKERRIVVSVEESEESMHALSWCLGNLLPENTKCASRILLYVKPPLPVYSSLDATEYLFGGDAIASMEKYGRDLASSVMRRAEAVYRDVNTNVSIKVEKNVGTGDAKDVISTAVDTLGADILVMGSHDYGFFKRALLGSVSNHCAKHVKCPHKIVKQPKHVQH